MFNCIVNYHDRQIAAFSPDDFPGRDSVNIGGAARCDVKLDGSCNPPPVLFSLTRVEKDLVAVAGDSEPLILDGKEVTSARILPGMVLLCGNFSLAFSGDLADSGKVFLWVDGKKKAQYATLGAGANLIGSGQECRGRIDKAGLPPLLCRCWVNRDGCAIEPMNSQYPIRIMGRKLTGLTDIAEGTVFEFAKDLHGTVIDQSALDRALKSGNPFYPELGTWQRAVLACMLLFVCSVLCYKVLEHDEPGGKIYRTVNAIPEYSQEKEADFLKKLEGLWRPMLKNGRYYAVQMDLEILLENKSLPEKLRKTFEETKERLDTEIAGMRLVRFYSSKLEIYSPEVMAKHCDNMEIQGAGWIKGIRNTLSYWSSADGKLKEAAEKRREAGMTEDSHFLPSCGELRKKIGKIIGFYAGNDKIAVSLAAGDFSEAQRIAAAPEFQEFLKLYSKGDKFMQTLNTAGELHSLVSEIKAPGLTPATLPQVSARAGRILRDFGGVNSPGEAFPPEITEKYLNMLDRFVKGMEAADKAEKACRVRTDGANLLAARKIFWQLSMSPLFDDNEYRKQMNAAFASKSLAYIKDKNNSLEYRGRLLENELSMLPENESVRTELETLLAELEKESDALCEKLYAKWLHAGTPREKRALEEKILHSSMPGSSYREWASSRE